MTVDAGPDAAAPERLTELDASVAVDAAAKAFAFDPTVPGGRKLRVWGLGVAACNPAPALRRLQPIDPESKCTAVKVRSAEASGSMATTSPFSAFDGDACTIWNAGGFAPQAVEARIDAVTELAAIVLVPEMTPVVGRAVHIIELGAGDSVRRRLVADATFTSNEGFLVLIDGPMHVNRVRVITTESPSWIAWREIMLVTCGPGAVNVARGVRELTAPPPRRIVPGKGACKSDADCVPEQCCGARTCNHRSLAPNCAGAGCGQSCGGDNMSCGQGSCVCENGTCGAWYHGIVRGLQ